MTNHKVASDSIIKHVQIKQEIVTLLFSDVKKSFIAAISVAGMLLTGLSDFVNLSTGFSWLGLLALTYMLRLCLGHQLKKDVIRTAHAITWLKRFRLSIALSGLAWGSAAFLIFPENNTQLQALFALALAGIAAGGLVSFYIDEVSSIMFVSAIVLPMSYVLINDPNPNAKNILGLAILFIIYVALAGKRMAMGLLSNIDLRVQAETQKKEIHELSLRQHLHLAQTPIGVIEWDKNLTITAWNKACSNIFGYSSEMMIGQHIGFLIPNLSKMPHEHILTALQKKLVDTSDFYEIIHQNGEIIQCEWTNTWLNNEYGEMIGMASLVQDKTEFMRNQDKVNRLAYYDTLTNLPNRGLLNDRLLQSIAISERTKTYSMIAFIDLDHFKALNDIKGHAAGDYLLIEVANRLKNNIRKQDTVARMGGDEFVLVLSDVGETPEEARLYCESIIDKISHAIKIPVEYDGYQHQCSASIGVSLFTGNSTDADELMRRADMSMYLAKKQGRNCYQFYDESMQPKYNYQMQLKHDLNAALENKQFQLYLQGQFDSDSTIKGAEVLLRWQHPTFGLVMPNDFIPLAEETGHIGAISFWVMKQACLLLKKWGKSAETAHLTMSINVSAIQFNNPKFLAEVKTAIQSSGCDATKLCIELTESAVINSIDDLSHKMTLLRELGISLAIDDFGVGYSSLSVLKNLPLTELKIDKSFVQDITNRSAESTIVKTILELGKNLNLRVVAEGVETESQLAYLGNYGCQIFQGYFFEKPCAVTTFEKKLMQNTNFSNTMHMIPAIKKTQKTIKNNSLM